MSNFGKTLEIELEGLYLICIGNQKFDIVYKEVTERYMIVSIIYPIFYRYLHRTILTINQYIHTQPKELTYKLRNTYLLTMINSNQTEH